MKKLITAAIAAMTIATSANAEHYLTKCQREIAIKYVGDETSSHITAYKFISEPEYNISNDLFKCVAHSGEKLEFEVMAELVDIIYNSQVEYFRHTLKLPDVQYEGNFADIVGEIIF